jgi:hypothetical protein
LSILEPAIRRLERSGPFERLLDGPHQVIIETAPTLVVSFDFGRFAATTQAAIAASLALPLKRAFPPVPEVLSRGDRAAGFAALIA